MKKEAKELHLVFWKDIPHSQLLIVPQIKQIATGAQKIVCDAIIL
jgi:hypothetical protein